MNASPPPEKAAVPEVARSQRVSDDFAARGKAAWQRRVASGAPASEAAEAAPVALAEMAASLPKNEAKADTEYAEGVLAALPGGTGDEVAKIYLIPSPPAAFIPRWYGPGETVVVAKLVLPGMVRVGAESAVGGSLHDPSMIDPELPVDGSSSICTLLNDSSLNYATLAPSDRGAYLNWIKNGRISPIPAGLAILFFKGLERRTFEIHSKLDAADELRQLAAEMRALAARYGPSSRLLETQASDLATLLESGVTGARAYAGESKTPRLPFSQSFELRLAVAQAAFDRAPLPANWALEWALRDANSILGTAMLRCAPELQRLFCVRYQERYGAGTILPVDGAHLTFNYSPISQAIPRGKTLTLAAKSTADVLDFSPIRQELSMLVDNCLNELSAFNRLSARSPHAARTIEGLMRLPLAAWPEDATEWFNDLGAEVRKAPKVITLDVFRLRFGGKSIISKEVISALFKALGTFGVGVEPTEFATMREVFTGERIALFFESGGSGHNCEPEDFRTCQSVVNLAIALAMFGGEMTTEDKKAIVSEIKSWRELTPSQVGRLMFKVECARAEEVDVKLALKQLAARDEATRFETLKFLTRLASRNIDSTRVRSGMLTQYRLGLASKPKTQVQRAAPPDAAARDAVASSTVTRPSPRPKAAPKRLTLDPVRLARVHQDTAKVDKVLQGVFTDDAGQADSKLPSTAANQVQIAPSAFALDPVRLARVQQDTAKVDKVLQGVFTDDAGQADSKPPSTAANQVQIAPSAFALDPTHRELLGHLLGRDSWALEELQTLVAQHELMLDGAMETLNEAVFDAYGVCLVEGDDPLEVNGNVRRPILDAMSAASSRTPG